MEFFGFEKGRYRLRLSRALHDVAAAQALRGRCFRNGEPDADTFDARCDHLLIEDIASGELLACLRVMQVRGRYLETSYSGARYDLSALEGLEGPFLELGRFCVAPDLRDPDILRLAWAGITRLVDARGVRFLIGCSSFSGADWRPVRDALALLAARHLLPKTRGVGKRAPETLEYPALLGDTPFAPERALQQMPPLLRSYLTMGGQVSDHAVIDRDLNTLHVFTLIETATIPEARTRALRAVAG